MTRDEAIEILKGAIKKPNTKDGYLGQAVTMAIHSLEAWDKVLDEISSSVVYPWDYDQLTKDYKIIKKHLKEVEDEQIHRC